MFKFHKFFFLLIIFLCPLTDLMSTNLPDREYLLSKEDKLKVFVVIGLPGAGKGTFGQYLKKNYNVGHISVGDLVREEAKSNKRFREFSQKMKLLPFKDTWPLIKKKIGDYLKIGTKAIMLDGYPRDIDQALLFNNAIKLSKNLDLTYIYLNIKENVAIERIKYRQICSSCKYIYNKKYSPSKNGVCFFCGLKVIDREDDQFIAKRIEKSRKALKDILSIYKPFLIEISTNDRIEKLFLIYDDLMKDLGIRKSKNTRLLND